MRIAYLIKTKADKAELVAHGPSVEVKKKFLELPIGKDEVLDLLGPDIRPKRRGGRQDYNALFATIAKEHQAVREASERAEIKQLTEALKASKVAIPEKATLEDLRKLAAGVRRPTPKPETKDLLAFLKERNVAVPKDATPEDLSRLAADARKSPEVLAIKSALAKKNS
jgi:hypothetical protein